MLSYFLLHCFCRFMFLLRVRHSDSADSCVWLLNAYVPRCLFVFEVFVKTKLLFQLNYFVLKMSSTL